MALTWAQFKILVRKALTDRQPNDTNFTAAVAEYVRAKQAMEGGARDEFALRQNRYTALRRGLMGYTPSLDDAALKTAVKVLLRDAGASDTLFRDAVAAFVRSQINSSDAAASSRFAALRQRLAGYQTTQNDAALQAAVRDVLSDASRSNAEFARACALFAKAELAREVDARSEQGLTGAMSISESARKDYERLRLRLVGYAHTLGGELQAEVNKFLPVDAIRKNTSTFLATLTASAVADIQAFGAWINAQIATAKEELQGYGGWLDQQILTARDDLQSLAERVDTEMRAGVIDLQHFIRAYASGHESTIVAGDVTTSGFASAGSLPDGAIVREAYLLVSPADAEVEALQGTLTPVAGEVTPLVNEAKYARLILVLTGSENQDVVKIGYDVEQPGNDAPMELPNLDGIVYDLSKVVIKTATEGDAVRFFAVLAAETEAANEVQLTLIPWASRIERMILNKTCDPLLAIDPRGSSFVMTPKLAAEETALLIRWDGTKLQFADGDEVPFDEDASLAVAKWVNAALAAEWGEAVAQQQIWRGEYANLRTRCYLKHKRRAEVAG